MLVLLKAPDMSCVRSDENFPSHWVLLFLGMPERRTLNVSVL